jgi:hypothetical protein
MSGDAFPESDGDDPTGAAARRAHWRAPPVEAAGYPLGAYDRMSNLLL